MLKTIIFIMITSNLLLGNSFSSAKKKLLKKVYYDHQITFYCQNPYSIQNINGKEKALIIKDSTKYTPRNEKTKKGKDNIRAKRIEWEHVIPAENFGRQFSCWREGNENCIKKNGKSFKGRKCCKKVSPIFRKMEADMMNLVPAIGEVNADRSNFRFMDTRENLKGQYGECNFKVDFKNRKAYPANHTKGFIARTNFYFQKKYKLKLSKKEQQMFKAWDKMYPKTEWEKLRESRIEKLQK